MVHVKTRIELIEEFCAVAEEILRVTALVALTGDKDNMEKETDDYAFLREKREPMVKRLIDLKEMAEQGQTHPVKDESFDAECERRWGEARRIMGEIEALDKLHIQASKRIMAEVKSAIRDIKSGKILSNVYAHPMEGETSGLLDAKK